VRNFPYYRNVTAEMAQIVENGLEQNSTETGQSRCRWQGARWLRYFAGDTGSDQLIACNRNWDAVCG